MHKTILIRLFASILALSFLLAEPSRGQNPPVATDDFYGVDQFGALNEPAPGVLVNDSDPDSGNTLTAALVTGPAHAVSFQLAVDGSFSYVPWASYYGPDTFTYRAYDGTLYSGPVTVHITVNQPGAQGFITGGGKFIQDNRKCTFGFVAKVEVNGVQGNLKFQDHDMGLDVKADIVDWVFAPNPVDGYFSGACSLNNMTSYSYFVQIHDAGQPGNNDDFSVWIYDSYNALVYSSGGQISGGNIVIHDFSTSLQDWWCDNDGDGYTVYAGKFSTAPASYCHNNPGLGPDCDDNDPNDYPKYWYCDSDGDCWYAIVGPSCAPPCLSAIEVDPGSGCLPGSEDPACHQHGCGKDCDDNDPNAQCG